LRCFRSGTGEPEKPEISRERNGCSRRGENYGFTHEKSCWNSPGLQVPVPRPTTAWTPAYCRQQRRCPLCGSWSVLLLSGDRSAAGELPEPTEHTSRLSRQPLAPPSHLFVAPFRGNG